MNVDDARAVGIGSRIPGARRRRHRAGIAVDDHELRRIDGIAGADFLQRDLSRRQLGNHVHTLRRRQPDDRHLERLAGRAVERHDP